MTNDDAVLMTSAGTLECMCRVDCTSIHVVSSVHCKRRTTVKIGFRYQLFPFETKHDGLNERVYR